MLNRSHRCEDSPLTSFILPFFLIHGVFAQSCISPGFTLLDRSYPLIDLVFNSLSRHIRNQLIFRSQHYFSVGFYTFVIVRTVFSTTIVRRTWRLDEVRANHRSRSFFLRVSMILFLARFLRVLTSVAEIRSECWCIIIRQSQILANIAKNIQRAWSSVSREYRIIELIELILKQFIDLHMIVPRSIDSLSIIVIKALYDLHVRKFPKQFHYRYSTRLFSSIFHTYYVIAIDWNFHWQCRSRLF